MPNPENPSLAEYRTLLEQRIERADANENVIERTRQLEALYEELDAVEADLTPKQPEHD